MRSSDSMFHRFYSTRKCFQQRLICFNTKRMLPAGENKCCRQTVLHISFCSFLSESDNLFISTWFRDKSRFHGITQLSFWAYTFASKLQFSFQILQTSETLMGISDEIKDATIAIDKTKISEIEATKQRFRNYCVQTKYQSVRPKKN